MRDSTAVDSTTLWKAAKKHDVSRVMQLLLHLHDATGSLDFVNEFHPKRHTTPLMAACQKKDNAHKNPSRSGADTIQTLLEFGADLNLQANDKDGNTALHFAALSNQPRAVEYMLHAQVDVFRLNNHGHAAIDLARWKRSRDVVDVLTQHARIHQGWLYVKKRTPATASSAASMVKIHVWKKRYGVALACDTDRQLIELSLYKSPTDVKPKHVILLRGDTHGMVSSPKVKWLDRHNMFHVDRPLVVQNTTTKRRFSRTDQTQRSSESAGETEQLRFAAESPQQRDVWMGILRRVRAGSSSITTAAAATAQQQQTQNYTSPFVFTTTNNTPRPAAAAATAPAGASAAREFSPVAASPFTVFANPWATQPLVSPFDTPSAYQYDTDDDSDSTSVTPTPSFPPPSAPSFCEAAPPPLAPPPPPPPAPPTRNECAICMDAPRDATCVPCGHVAGCHPCLTRYVQENQRCLICRAAVQSVIKIYNC